MSHRFGRHILPPTQTRDQANAGAQIASGRATLKRVIHTGSGPIFELTPAEGVVFDQEHDVDATAPDMYSVNHRLWRSVDIDLKMAADRAIPRNGGRS